MSELCDYCKRFWSVGQLYRQARSIVLPIMRVTAAVGAGPRLLEA